MKNKRRTSPVPHRLGAATLCLALGGLLADPVAADAPPLVVFAPDADGNGQVGAAARSPLSAGGAATLEQIHADPLASHVRVGALSAEALTALTATRAFSVAASGGPRAFDADDVEDHPNGMRSVRSGAADAHTAAAFVVDGDDIVGSYRIGRTTWKMTPLGGGRTAVYRYDTRRLRHHSPADRLFMQRALLRPPTAAAAARRADPAAARGTIRIDWMAAYTSEVETRVGNVHAAIQLAVDNTNRAWRDSDMDLRLHHVHTMDLGFATSEEDWFYTLIEDLTRPEEPAYAIHAERDRHGADLARISHQGG